MKQISAAFVKAKRSFGPALKDKTNPAFRSKYADLGACLEAVEDALLENGIALLQETFDDPSGVTVETVFLHESGEERRCGKLHVPASKQDPQGYGSALTYARRYSLMAACGIAPEDDDGNAASKPKKDPKQDLSGIRHSPMKGVDEQVLPPEVQEYIKDLAKGVTDAFRSTDTDWHAAAVQQIKSEGLDDLQKMTLWAQLDSKTRSAFKKVEQEIHKTKEPA